MTIFRVMDLSTAHVTKKTMDALAEGSADLTSYGYPEGAFVHLPTDDLEEELEERGLPEDLRKVVKFAMDHDCQWVKLDADGEVCGDLPTYEWA
jgi:hypothetical protein